MPEATTELEATLPGRPRPSLVDALIPVGALVVLLALSYYLFGDTASGGPNQVALVFCGLVAAGIGYKNGLPFAGIREAAVDGIRSGLPAIFILLAVGALIGTWAQSGTIVAMVYYGLSVLSPTYFYATSALICAVVALSIGSSWTVAGTIGIGLMGIAQGMGLSPAITAGAVISGAYFGDKASPLSDTVNLAAAAAGSEVFDHIRESLWTSVPALALALIGFALLGQPGHFDSSQILQAIESKYTVSLWAFVPLVVVFVLAVVRFPPASAIFIGALVGGVVAVVLNPDKVVALAASPEQPTGLSLLKGVWMALASGHESTTGLPALDKLLSRGGMASMLVTVWLIMTALMFGAIVEHAGMLDRLIGPVLERARSAGALVGAVVVSCIGANIITSDQYIAVVLPGRMFKAEFKKRGLAPVLLSRVVGDSAIVTSPLVPWNSCGAYMAATLAVPTSSFLIFCFFNILNPLLTVLYSFAGIRVIHEPAPLQTAGGADKPPG